jgi:hypothetical protein
MRVTTDDDWGEPVNLGPTINTPVGEYGVSISYDGLSLYFDTRQPGASGAVDDLWVATRTTTNDDWNNPVSLGPMVNSLSDECYPSVSSDGLDVYFCSNRSGGVGTYDLWVTMRATTDDNWNAPVNLGPTVNSSYGEADPGISSGGLVLFFSSGTRPGGYGQGDIWMTKRATINDDWGEPVNLGPPVNSSAWEAFPNVSVDGSYLFFTVSQSARHSGGDIWQVPIIPIIDFNADGIVDAADMCFMVNYWGTDEPLCDIGPMPWGDGIVDIEDLKILAKNMFQEVEDPTLIAHWAFDETEGMFAADSAGNNNAIVIGGSIWQPDSGQINGALQLDGVSGYAITGEVLNPADGPFSICAWVKGGASGQIIVSQQFASDWLATDAEGNLMTELKSSDPLAEPLVSETIITDEQWHRIGLVWDGSHRILYVDGIAVAEDVQDGLEGSENGLNIGAGKMTQPGTYFSGLIDDVRIYNRVVSP